MYTLKSRVLFTRLFLLIIILPTYLLSMNDTQKKLITALWQIQDIDFKYNWTLGLLSNYLQASTKEEKSTVEKNILQLPELHLINMDIDNVLKFLKIQ